MLSPVFMPAAEAADLAQVNGVGIPESEVKASIRIYLKQIGHDTLSPDRLAVLKNKVLKRHIEEELLYQEAGKRALSVSDDEVRLAVSQIKRRFISEEAYKAALVRETLLPEDIWLGARRSALIKKAWHFFADMEQEERQSHLASLIQNARIEFLDDISTEANLHLGVD